MNKVDDDGWSINWSILSHTAARIVGLTSHSYADVAYSTVVRQGTVLRMVIAREGGKPRIYIGEAASSGMGNRTGSSAGILF